MASKEWLAAHIMHQPVRVLMGQDAVCRHSERCQPDAGAEPCLANALGDVGHTMGELVVDAEPVANRCLVAIVNLYQVYRQGVSERTNACYIFDHALLSDAMGIVVPAAPAGGNVSAGRRVLLARQRLSICAEQRLLRAERQPERRQRQLLVWL